jgi:1,2-dihydroxy-3-keto-5-methylthiopentene dioxygenase
MAKLFITKTQETITDFTKIKSILNGHNILIEQWEANTKLADDANQETILAAYSHELKPFMEKYGFETADVINVTPSTPNLQAIREKFMKEHRHSDDEIRFFVDGQGIFWFHLDNDEVIAVTCTAGDFMSVPKNFRHWFDLHPNYFVKAIRIFSNMEGWVPLYTNSNVDSKYNP